MIVLVDHSGEHAAVSVELPDVLTSLHIEHVGPEHHHAGSDLEELGVGFEVDHDHAAVSIDWLAEQVVRSNDAAMRAEFDAMIRYARSKGWVDDDRKAVRAHIVVG